MRVEVETDTNDAKQIINQSTDALRLTGGISQKLTQQRKVQELENMDLLMNFNGLQEKYNKAETERIQMKENLESMEAKLEAEIRHNAEVVRVNNRLQTQLKSIREQIDAVQREKHQLDLDCKRREESVGELKRQSVDDANLIVKLQLNIRKLIERVTELEEELNTEKNARCKSERIRAELQADLSRIQQQMEETSGELVAQKHINSIRAEEVSNLQREIEKRSIDYESYISSMCSMQYMTISNLRTLSKQAASLEMEVNRILSARDAMLKLCYDSSSVKQADTNDENLT
ncbi:hypothetical protein DICVIV_00676 [Dictyocaulus viviparus]|uniref:Myosin tail domain-containing protein n=1 Tax=Dictyocaulus viviparus TaxID=29172 RepID=A0A0D8Y8N5_DICVI|nr:hypothetical protein DICVIV_00676 [Dictyocaulus viviparus]